MDITVDTGLKAFAGDIDKLTRQLPYATALGLQRVTFTAQRSLQDEINRKVDRPNRLTQNAVLVAGPARGIKITNLSALKKDPSTFVFIRDEADRGTPPEKYLHGVLSGGNRRHKRFEKALMRAGIMRSNEYAVPGDDIRLDRYGNIPQGAIVAMLSQLKASPDELQNATGSTRSKGKRRSKAYFYRPEFRGIFVRTSKKAFTVFIKFVTKQPGYTRKVQAKRTVDDVVGIRWPIEFKRALTEAFKTAI